MDQSMMLWAFILIGNGAALVALSMITAGGTSAMGDGPPAYTNRAT